MYEAQQCSGLSDECIEDAIYDSQAIPDFVGVDPNWSAVPDATTLGKSHPLLEAHDLTRQIYETITAHLAARGPAAARPRSAYFPFMGSLPAGIATMAGAFPSSLPTSSISGFTGSAKLPPSTNPSAAGVNAPVAASRR